MRFLLILLLITMSATASAAERPYYAVGFTNKDQQTFDNDLWAGLSMKKYYTLVESIGSNLSKTERGLLRDLLTTEAKPPMSNTADAEKDYLAVRMKKLIELGYPQDSVALYQLAQKYDLPKDIHKLGIIAGFFSDKGDLACLDYRAAVQKTQLDKWEDAEILCGMIDTDFEDAPKKSISIENFNKLPFEKQSLIFSHKNITLKHKETVSLKDRPAPLTLLFIAQKMGDTPSLHYKIKLLLDDYGIKSVAFDKNETEASPDFKLYKQRQTLLDKDADKEDRAESFKAILKQRLSIPAAFFAPLMQKNYAAELEIKLSAIEIFDLAAIAEELNIESPYKNEELESNPALPFVLLHNKSSIKPEMLENWFNNFCFDTPVFNPRFCMNTYLLADKQLGKNFTPEIKKQIYGKFFTLTSYVNYAMPIDDILGLYPSKPLNKNKGYNLLYGLRLGSDGVNTLSFPLFEVTMSLAEDGVLAKKTAHQLSIKNMVTLKETN